MTIATKTEWADLAASLKSSYKDQIEDGVDRPVGLFNCEYPIVNFAAGEFGPLSNPSLATVTGDHRVEIDLHGEGLADGSCWDAVDEANGELTGFGVQLDWHGCATESNDDVVDDGDVATVVARPWITFLAVTE